jgi:hypothetical protein
MGILGMIVSFYKDNNVILTVLLKRVKKTFISDHTFDASLLDIDALSLESVEFLTV